MNHTTLNELSSQHIRQLMHNHYVYAPICSEWMTETTDKVWGIDELENRLMYWGQPE